MMNEQEESVLFSKALAFASEKHAGQIRKDGSPYIFHPIRVAKMIADAGYGINYQITGLFHDILEDTDAIESEVAAYGEDVLEAVKLVSKNYCTNKKYYIDNILKSHIAAVVKNADRIDNLWEACYGEDSFQKRYLENSKQEYKGKFSEALDLSISRLESQINHKEKRVKREYPAYESHLMVLYLDKE